MPRLLLQKPHSEGQRDLISSGTKDVVFCGRRWGKTHSGVQRIVRASFNKAGLYWWVGLGWRSASLKNAWRALKNIASESWYLLEEDPKKKIRENDKQIFMPGGSEIWLRTAERPDSLAGESVSGAVIDEFSLMPEEVWTEYLEGCLLDKRGWAMFMGVPKGNNWASRLWNKAKTREGWRQWRFPTSANPTIEAADLEDLRLNNTERLFRQEYLAEIVDFTGQVFLGVDDVLTEDYLYEPEDNHTYAAGLDWGKKLDYTVLSIFDACCSRQVSLTRTNASSYLDQLAELRPVVRTFNPYVIQAEENAMGDPLCDQLIEDGFPIQRYTASNESKRRVIDSLQVAIEHRRVRLLNDRVQRQEFEEYECKVSNAGNFIFSAPKGGHDDTIIATALAWDAINFGTGVSL